MRVQTRWQLGMTIGGLLGALLGGACAAQSPIQGEWRPGDSPSCTGPGVQEDIAPNEVIGNLMVTVSDMDSLWRLDGCYLMDGNDRGWVCSVEDIFAYEDGGFGTNPSDLEGTASISETGTDTNQWTLTYTAPDYPDGGPWWCYVTISHDNSSPEHWPVADGGGEDEMDARWIQFRSW